MVHQSTYYVAAMAAFAVITACYNNIAISLSLPARRGRPQADQRHPAAGRRLFLTARVLHALFVSVLLVAITVAFGRVFYHAEIPTGR